MRSRRLAVLAWRVHIADEAAAVERQCVVGVPVFGDKPCDIKCFAMTTRLIPSRQLLGFGLLAG